MNRSVLFFVLAASLLNLLPLAACTSPDASLHSARDVPDEPAATAPSSTAATSPTDTGEHPTPLADRMRTLDKAIYKLDVDDLPAIGSSTAPLTIVLFTDYECPFCRKLEPQIAQLRAEHGSDVRIVLAPRPLPFHSRAKPAALAAIAAFEQGKLEPMHRALVALDGKLEDDALTSAAREAGLDLARFEADRKSAKSEKTLAKAEELAKRFSVRGTPTTFINGRRITGAVPEVIHELGEEQLVVGRGLVRTGTPASKVYDTIVAGGLESAGPDPSVGTIRMVGPDGATQKPPYDLLVEMTKCWGQPGATPPTKVELTIGGDGKVTGVATEPSEHSACVTKAASTIMFEKKGAPSKLTFAIGKP
jgi:protein-disulfide isomerase